METVILYSIYDFMVALNNRNTVYISLLEFPVTFHLISHSILLQHLKNKLRISGLALKWLKPHLTDMTQYISIGGTKSSMGPMTYGVTQGSLHCPILFLIYTVPII